MPPSPTASWLTCDPALIGKSAGAPVSCDGSAMRVPETASGSTSLDLDQVGRHRVADGDVLLGDEDVHGALLGRLRAFWLPEQDDDADERQDGEQHADEDDQAIGSLHEYFPSSEDDDNPAVQSVRRCDCGQQSTGQPQPASTGLIGYAAVGTSEASAGDGP